MKCDIYESNRFHEVASTWDRINSVSADLPILDSSMIACALEHFGTGDELICIASDSSRPALGLVLRKRGPLVYESFQPSQLPIGPTVAVPDLELGAAVSGIARKLPGLALSVGLTELDPLLLERPAAAADLRTMDYVETAWIDIDCSFDDYWSQRGKNLRQNVRKQLNKLESEGTPARLTIVESAPEIPAAIAAYGELESSGWKGTEGTAVHASNAQGRFYTALLESFCAKGLGKVYQLWVGDKLVASDICIEQGRVHVVLKTAHDESEKRYSPSTLLRYFAFRSFFDEGHVRRIEFYGKRMEWHTRWTDKARTLYHLTHYRSSAVRKLVNIAGRLRNDSIHA